MEIQGETYDKKDFIETANGNKIARLTSLNGSQQIVLNGKVIVRSGVVLRGDLARIRLGAHCVVGERAVVRPAAKRTPQGGWAFLPLHIGSNVWIGHDVVLQAANIGDAVHLGDRCILGPRVIVKDCVTVMPDTVVPADTVLPPFALVQGNPAQIVGQSPFCTMQLMKDATETYYKKFVPRG